MPERSKYQISISDPEGILVDAPEKKKRAEDFLKKQDAIDVAELIHTPEEVEKIRGLNWAISRVLRKLGLPEIEIPEEAIHIIDPKEFERDIMQRFGVDLVGAVTKGTHMYVQRTPDRALFMNDFSHEAAHLISYYRQRAVVHKVPEGIGAGIMGERRGYDTRYGQKSKFSGMDEALIELLGGMIRAEYYEAAGLNKKETAPLAAPRVYLPHIYVMRRIFELLGADQAIAVSRNFIKGLVSGDVSILKKLEKKHKGIVKILADMGTEKEDALAVADKLGFADVREKIEELIEEE